MDRFLRRRWFDALNWSDSIPNAAGDIARFQRSLFAEISVDLTSPVTLGHLELAGAASYTLTGTGSLLFDNAGQAAILDVVPADRRSPNHHFEVPLAIALGEPLLVNISERASLALQGGIAQGGGDLVKQNSGTLELAGASPNWDGMLTVDEGTVLLRNPASLGTAAGLTRINLRAR